MLAFVPLKRRSSSIYLQHLQPPLDFGALALAFFAGALSISPTPSPSKTLPSRGSVLMSKEVGDVSLFDVGRRVVYKVRKSRAGDLEASFRSAIFSGARAAAQPQKDLDAPDPCNVSRLWSEASRLAEFDHFCRFLASTIEPQLSRYFPVRQ